MNEFFLKPENQRRIVHMLIELREENAAVMEVICLIRECLRRRLKPDCGERLSELLCEIKADSSDHYLRIEDFQIGGTNG